MKAGVRSAVERAWTNGGDKRLGVQLGRARGKGEHVLRTALAEWCALNGVGFEDCVEREGVVYLKPQ